MNNITDSLKAAHSLLIYGTSDIYLFWITVVFGILGMIARILITVVNRDPLTPYSPIKFSWGYFMQHNLVRFVINLFLTILAIRFCNEVMGQQLNPFVGLGIGLSADLLGKKFATKGEEVTNTKN